MSSRCTGDELPLQVPVTLTQCGIARGDEWGGRTKQAQHSRTVQRGELMTQRRGHGGRSHPGIQP